MVGAWIKSMAVGMGEHQTQYVKKVGSTNLRDWLDWGEWERNESRIIPRFSSWTKRRIIKAFNVMHSFAAKWNEKNVGSIWDIWVWDVCFLHNSEDVGKKIKCDLKLV